jgi:hypothetical protein
MHQLHGVKCSREIAQPLQTAMRGVVFLIGICCGVLEHYG